MNDNKPKYIVYDPDSKKTYRIDEEQYKSMRDDIYTTMPNVQVARYGDVNLDDDAFDKNGIYHVTDNSTGKVYELNGQEYGKMRGSMKGLSDFSVKSLTQVNDFWEEKQAELDLINQRIDELTGKVSELDKVEEDYRIDALELGYAPPRNPAFEKAAEERDALNVSLDEARRMRNQNPAYHREINMASQSVSTASNEVQAKIDRYAAEHPEDFATFEAGERPNAGPAPDSGYRNIKDWKSNEAYVNLKAARSLYADAQKVLKKPSRYDDSGWLGNLIKGLTENPGSLISICELHKSYIQQPLLKIIHKIQDEKGEKVNILELVQDDKEMARILSSDEQDVLKAFVARSSAEALRNGDISLSYQAGDTIAGSIGFMLDFILTGRLGGAASKGATKAMSRIIAKSSMKAGLRGVTREAALAVPKFTTGTIESAIKTAATTPFMPSSWSNFQNSLMQMNDAGEVDLSGKTIWNNVFDVLIENFSEYAGTQVEGLLAAPFRAVGYAGKKAFNGQKWFNKWGETIAHMNTGRAKILKDAAFNGYLGEYGEEWYGNALRVLFGVDENALRDFATWDQQIVTLTSFAPMSVIGGVSSAVQYRKTKNKVASTGEELKNVLLRKGYDEETIRNILSVVKSESPAEIAQGYANALAQVRSDNATFNKDGELLIDREMAKALGDYAYAVAQFRTVEGIEEADISSQRDQLRESMSRSMGSKMQQDNPDLDVSYEGWINKTPVDVKNEKGETEQTNLERVRVLSDSNGNRWFVTAEDSTQYAVVNEKGERNYIPKEGSPLGDTGWLNLNDFLEMELARKKQAAEQERMKQESANNMVAVRQSVELNAPFEFGTKEERHSGIVTSIGEKGIEVTVEGESEPLYLSWEDVAREKNMPLAAKSDAALEEDELANKERVVALNKSLPQDAELQVPIEDTDEVATYTFTRAALEDGEVIIYAKNEDGKEVQLLPEMIANLDNLLNADTAPENNDTPAEIYDDPVANQLGIDKKYLELSTDGKKNVNTKALWEDNPELWAKYNDLRELKDIETIEYISSKLTKAQAAAAAAETKLKQAALNDADEKTKEALRSDVAKKAAWANRIQALLNSYTTSSEVVKKKSDVTAGTNTKSEENTSALSRIPKEGKTYRFEAAPVKTTVQALLELAKGDVRIAIKTAARMSKLTLNKVDKARNTKVKGDNPFDISNAENEKKELISRLNDYVMYWNEVKESLNDMLVSMARSETELQTPMNLNEVVANFIAGLRPNSLNREDFAKELGWGETELKRFFPYWAKKGEGYTVQKLAEQIGHEDTSGLVPQMGEVDQADTNTIRDAIIDVFQSVASPKGITEYTRNANLERKAEEQAYWAGLQEEQELQNESLGNTSESVEFVEDMPEDMFSVSGAARESEQAWKSRSANAREAYKKAESEWDETEKRLADATPEEREAIMLERAAILQRYYDTISDNTTVSTSDTVVELLRKEGVEERLVKQVEKGLKDAKASGADARAFYMPSESGFRLFILADKITGIEDGRLAYVHEEGHHITRLEGYVRNVMAMSGISRERLAEWVRNLSGTSFYDDYPAEVLADEALSMCREIAYSTTSEELAAKLREKGIDNEEFINFVKNIDDEQRKSQSYNLARITGRTGDSVYDQRTEGAGRFGRQAAQGQSGQVGLGSSENGTRSAREGQKVDSTGALFSVKEKPITAVSGTEKKRINSTIDKAIAFVDGISVKDAKEQRLARERQRKEEAAELYSRVLNSQFDDVTLQLIDKYIDDGTPKNPYGKRISQRLPQEVERSLYAQSRTAKVDALFSRICEAAVGSSRRALPSERLKIQKAKNAALKAWAIASGNWHTDLSAFTNDTKPFASGTDSDVYMSKDGEYAIKASKGKSSAKKFAPDLDNIPLYNYIFPNTSYEILGYGEIGGKFIRILKQPFVDFDKSREVTVDERVQFMHELGFEPINKDKTVFSNKNLVVADLQKSNIVYDKLGNIMVIDADVKLHTKDVGGDYTYPPVEDDVPDGAVRFSLAEESHEVTDLNNDEQEGTVLFSVKGKKGEKSLVGIHNISAGKLASAVKTGGLANPSMAVIDLSFQKHEDYGEISLIAPSSLIDPETGRNAGTYTGDAWTPTYPGVTKQMSDKGWDKFFDDVRPLPYPFGATVRNDWREYLEDDRMGRSLRWWFLQDTGKTPETVMHSVNLSEADRELFKLLEGKTRHSDILHDEELWPKVVDLYKRLGDPAEVENALKKHPVKEGRGGFTEYLEARNREVDDWGIWTSPVFDLVESLQRELRREGQVAEFATYQAADKYIEDNNLQDAFEQWLQGKEKEYGVNSVLFAGWTRVGDRKYVPNTVENASRLMNQEPAENAYGNGGVSATRSLLLKRMESLSEIRKNRGLLGAFEGYASETEEYKEATDNWFNVINTLAGMQKVDDNQFINVDIAEARLQEAIQQRDPIAYLNREYRYGLTKDGEFAEALKASLKEIKALPSKYFETKFNRPVYLNEFAAAVVPSDTRADVRKELEKAGLPIYEYDSKTEGSRKESVLKASEADGIRFSVTGQKEKKKAPASAVPGDESPFKATDVTSADGANVLNNLESFAKEAENLSFRVKNSFLRKLAENLGAKSDGSNSKYATFEAKNGTVFTLRLADHNAKVSNFDNRDEDYGISLIISRKANEGITNDGTAHVEEFFYSDKSLRKSDSGTYAKIVRSVIQSLYSGAYKDATGLAQHQEVNGEPQSKSGVLFSVRDNEYFSAVQSGNMAKAQELVNKAAAAAGYTGKADYQGSLAFNGAAPSANGYFETREDRKEAFDNGEFEDTYSLGDFMEVGLDNNDLQWQLDNPVAASARDKATLESIRNISNVVKGNKGTIRMYRAVPADIKEGSFRNGDWITPSRQYAEHHIELQDWKGGRIIEQEVSVDDIWWDGNDINEWGFDDGNGYAYKNTMNNRKLLDPVTYDDNGNVIPLSQRFNDSNPDVRFSVTSAVQEEMDRIKAAAQADGTFMKAPNGKATNLSEEQWLLVRTPNFKKWFGDWEKSSRIEKLRGSATIEHKFGDEYALDRKSAKEWMHSNLKGEYVNADTQERITISNVGVNEVFSHGSTDEAHLKSISAIPALINGSIFIDEVPNSKGNDKYDSYRYYVAGIKIDGVDYTAKVVVGVKGDSKYYDHRLSEIEKGSLIDTLNRLSNSVDATKDPNLSGIKDSKLISILQNNFSKILDNNGEPAVVYRGAPFDPLAQEPGMGVIKPQRYFSPSEEYADRYRGNGATRAYYLNIKHPFDIRNKKDRELWQSMMPDWYKIPETFTGALDWAEFASLVDMDEFMEEHPEYDGVVLDEGGDPDGKGGVIERGVSYIPLHGGTQVKSATDNSGDFSQTNPDVRFSVVNKDKWPGYDNKNLTAAVKAEMDSIRQATIAGSIHMKAPNGKTTNLSETNWLLTRTANFKKYFGDWELAQLLRDSEKAWNGNYNFNYGFIPSERLKIRFAELLGHEVNSVHITGDSVRHFKSRHSENEELRGQVNLTSEDTVLIPYLMNNFDTMDLDPDNNKAGRKAVIISKRINGVSMIGTLETGKDKEYVITGWRFKGSDVSMQKNSAPKPNVHDDSEPSIAKVKKDIENIKASARNTSQAVDENGEPLVVHHGSYNKGIEEFNNEHKWSDAPDNTFWFSSKRSNAETYQEDGGDIIEAFLSIKNPLVVDAKGMNWSQLPARYEVYIDKNGEDVDEYFDTYDEALRFAQKHGGKADDIIPDGEVDTNEYARRAMAKGYDGLIVRNVTDLYRNLGNDASFEDETSDVYAAFDSRAIKHASENNGEFNGEKAKIRFSVTGQIQDENGNVTRFSNEGGLPAGTIRQTLVERTYRKTGAFSFTGKEKIESAGDVAYIFKELETAAVENSFIVYVKDGVPTILHTGIGNIDSVNVDEAAFAAGLKDFAPDEVYMVHNHPSGRVEASRADISELEVLQRMAGDVPVSGVIIDTLSGEYGLFAHDTFPSTLIDSRGKSNEGNFPLEVQAFDKMVFAPEYKASINESRINDPGDIASYLSAHRLGSGPKVGTLLLNKQRNVVGNVVLNDNSISWENAETLARQVVDAAVHSAATSVVLFGDFAYDLKSVALFRSRLALVSGGRVSVLDVVRVEGNHTRSMADGTLGDSAGLHADVKRYDTSNGTEKIIYDKRPATGKSSSAPNSQIYSQSPSSGSKGTNNSGNSNTLNDSGVRFSARSAEELDREYMRAIEADDMETAARLVSEAARKAMPESAVVDDFYRPKVVLHGTRKQFTAFDPNKIGSANDAGWLGRGFYFYANNPTYAAQYAFFHNKEGNGRVIHAFLNIENPYWASVADFQRLAESNSREDSERFTKMLKEEGYDGVYYNGDGNEEWVAFYPEQIKSAETVTYDDKGNVIPLSERFNVSNNDIRFSAVNFGEFSIENLDTKRQKLHATKPLNVVVGTIKAGNGLRPMEAAYKWYDDNIGKPREYDTEVGKVIIDKESIQESLGHKFGQAKLDAVSSLFDGFKVATYLTSTPDFDGKPITDHYFAYPIQYDGATNYVLCRAREDVNKNRLYIHEVFPMDKIKSETIQTLAGQSQPQRGRALYEKLLAAVLYGKGTNNSGNSNTLNDSGVRFSVANRNQEVFISNAAKAAQEVKMDKATPEQWIKMLEKGGGLKAGEDKWIGLSDWLKEQKGSVTKGQVLDYINEHQIQIEEVHYTGEPKGFEELQEEYDNWLHEEGYDYAHEQLIERFGDDAEIAFDDFGGELTIANEEAAAALLGSDNIINSDRLYYTTEGLDNKREIALTVPTIEPWNESDKIHFGDAGEGRAVAWIRFGDTMTERGSGEAPIDVKYIGAEPEDEPHRRAVDGVLLNWKDTENVMRNTSRKNQFGSAKSMYENSLRDNYYDYKDEERTLVAQTLGSLDDLKESDFEPVYEGGKKVLVIDEIQSKRHQEGREKGYKEDYEKALQEATNAEKRRVAAARAFNDKYGELPVSEYAARWRVFMNSEEYQSLSRASGEAEEKVRRMPSTDVPSAPFEKNWHELAMKRMLRLAAEEGYDYVAWTTGEQQAERYDIGNTIDYLYVDKRTAQEGRYVRVKPVYGSDTYELLFDEKGVITDGSIDGEPLVGKTLGEVFGKEVAVKILSADNGENISLQGQRIGGDGMKGFYDDILPRFMNKYGKKWGVKVEDITLDGIGEGGYPLTMHSVPVTQEMKESVMQGQVMFSVRAADEVRNEGISAVVGQENVGDFYMNLYRALPAEMRKEVADKAMGNGLNFRSAMQDYISNAAAKDNDRTGLVRMAETMLKDYAEGELNDAASRYALWRGGRGVNDNDLLDVAHDQYMRNHLDVTNSQVRFSAAGDVKEQIGQLFDAALSGQWKGKPITIGHISHDGKAYLESLSGIKMKENVDFVLNPSDLVHIYKEHFGDNEKDKSRNIPLTKEDIKNIYDVLKQPEEVVYLGNDGNSGAKFAFLKAGEDGTYNLIEVYANRKGNLTSKTFYKTKRGVSRRAMVLEKESLHSTSITSGATSSSANIPILFDSPNNDVRFSVGDEVKAADAGAEAAIDEANDALKQSKKEIKDLLTMAKAMGLQKEYDKKTVEAVTNLAKQLLKDQYIDQLSRREVSRLLGIVRTSVGRSAKMVKKNADAIVEIVIDNLLKRERDGLKKLISTTGTKTSATGVVVMGSLDVQGQKTLKAFNNGLKLEVGKVDDSDDSNTLYGMRARLQDRLASKDDAVRKEAEAEDAGLALAIEYKEGIKALEDEEVGLEEEIKGAAAKLKDGEMSKTNYEQFVRTTEDAVRENHIRQVEIIREFRAKMQGVLSGSAVAKKSFIEREKERVEAIRHLANSDMQGRSASKEKRPGFRDNLANSPIVRFFAAPLATFDQMLRLFGEKSIDGKGYLFNKFMGGWQEATERAYIGQRDAKAELDKKASEVFGREMLWSDLYDIERNMPTVTVKWWDDGKMTEHELTQGQLLYIYMVDKMTDGRMKLRKMGIDEEHVEAIRAQMDERFLKLADWLQDEYLVNLRNKYNAIHERLFGASMAAIENYFPLKINKRDLNRNEDISAPDYESLPSTTTGAIIKRTRNSKALDLLNADAFSVVIEHIDQMEKWAAFAEFNKDVNALLSYKRFRNQVQNMASVYGSGTALWSNFKDVCRIAGNAYHPQVGRNQLDTAAVNVAKGVTAAKINFRVYTALKQFLSMPAFVADANIGYLAKNMATPWKAWNWAMDNLPIFEKRWKSRIAGDTRLMSTESDWKLWQNKIVETAGRLGMTPNAFVDAVTVAVGARSMYETKYAQYIKEGFSEEQADKKAKQDATVLYNETQQSNESAFLSTAQLDRTVFATAITVFRNSSMGFQRQVHDAIRNLGKHFKSSYREQSIAFMTKQLVREGLSEEQAATAAERRYNRSFWRDSVRLATFGFLVEFAWNLGGSIAYLLFGDDDDEKEKMLAEAAKHALIGGAIEGLAGGNVMSDALNMVAKGESLRNYDPTLLPILSDMKRTYAMMSYDWVAGFNELVNLGVQACIGVNPQTITDGVVAVIDACNGDLETSKEAMLLIMRVLQVPQSQIDQIYIDELGTNAAGAKRMSPKQMAERYADYKLRRNAPLTGGLYSDELKEKRRKSYEKSFNKKVKERK